MPSGTVTLLFTDIEGSTRAWEDHPGDMQTALRRHDALLRQALEGAGGYVFKTVGDAFCAAFSTPRSAVAAAAEAQRAVWAEPWPAATPIRVRMALHTGVCEERDGDYFGPPVNRVARLEAAAHGGQTVLSRATVELLGDALPPGVSLGDLGEHRLKDLDRPVHTFQMNVDGLPSRFPPLRSLNSPGLPNNLPVQPSSFVGRRRELAEVRRLVSSARLVTLTGAGGSGKTRLALQTAADLLDGSGDGVWLVDLAPLGEAELVPLAVADVLGVRADGSRPPTDVVAHAVGGRSLLILLDNCEHLVEAAAALAHRLLQACPRLALLATSREPLGIGGEHVYRVPSLGVPGEGDDPDAVRRSEAVRLLTERAAQHGAPVVVDASTAEVIGRVCRRLDGIPLAIELGAARLRTMSVSELEARLDQRFSLLTGGSRAALARQQTLMATVGWSWDLLSAAERLVLARLSVFAGGFELAAAEAVAGDAVPVDEVVVHLAALVDKSLVQFDHPGDGPARYRLIETVRQYALDKLEEQGPTSASEARLAHRDHYLALAEAAAPQLVAYGQAEWLDRLDLELDNLRAAIAFSLGQPDPAPGLRLVTALRTFWKARGHAGEAAEALELLLRRPASPGAPLLRARALAAAAYLLEQTGGYAEAQAFAGEGLDLARSAGDERLEADLLYVRAFLLLRQGETAPALPVIERGLGLSRRLDDPHLTACLLAVRSFALDSDGDHAGATRDASESLALYRRVGDRREVGTMLGNLGYAALSAGDLAAARAHLVESLDIARELDDGYGVVYETFNLGLAEYLDTSAGAAGARFAESLDLARRLGMRASTAYAMIGLAMAAGEDEQPRSARLHGAADGALAVLGETVEPLEAGLRDAHRQRLRAAMGDEGYSVEYAAGRALAPEEALALALGGRP